MHLQFNTFITPKKFFKALTRNIMCYGNVDAISVFFFETCYYLQHVCQRLDIVSTVFHSEVIVSVALNGHATNTP